VATKYEPQVKVEVNVDSMLLCGSPGTVVSSAVNPTKEASE
jgi:hypothetical protein